MAIYRKCTQCGKKVPEYTLCKCEEKKKLNNYKDYKRRRMMDKEERERQAFYTNNTWLTLSETIKIHYFGLCIVCWARNLTEESKYTHHIETIKESFYLRLSEDNLVPLCDSCHKRVHILMDNNIKDKIYIQKTLKNLINKFNQEFY